MRGEVKGGGKEEGDLGCGEENVADEALDGGGSSPGQSRHGTRVRSVDEAEARPSGVLHKSFLLDTPNLDQAIVLGRRGHEARIGGDGHEGDVVLGGQAQGWGG